MYSWDAMFRFCIIHIKFGSDDPRYTKFALHVFGSNAKVNSHNAQCLSELSSAVKVLPAIDKYLSFVKNYTRSDDLL